MSLFTHQHRLPLTVVFSTAAWSQLSVVHCLVYLVVSTVTTHSAFAASSIDIDLISVQGADDDVDCLPKLRELNQTGYCECSSLLDIRCKELGEIPRFEADQRLYAGIYLADQSITQVPQAALSGLKVRKVVLNFNPIEDRLDAGAWSGVEEYLEELHMGDCKIRSLPEGMLNELNELRYLHMWNNQISFIPATYFKGCRNLRELILWGNRIERIDQFTFAGLWKLKKLDLDRNRISVLPKDAFQHLSGLEVIHLGENRIREIHSETFQFAYSLKVLSMDGNDLNRIYPKSFHGINGLLSLALHNNNISYLPSQDLFANLSKLTTLLLQHNHLQTIWGKTFSGLQALSYLDLSDNHLAAIPDTALRKTPRLRRLYVDDNELKTFSRCILSKRQSPHQFLRTLSLLGNPFVCDCRLTWLVDLREREGVSVWGTCSQTPSPVSIVNAFTYKAASCKMESYECKQ